MNNLKNLSRYDSMWIYTLKLFSADCIGCQFTIITNYYNAGLDNYCGATFASTNSYRKFSLPDFRMQVSLLTGRVVDCSMAANNKDYITIWKTRLHKIKLCSIASIATPMHYRYVQMYV